MCLFPSKAVPEWPDYTVDPSLLEAFSFQVEGLRVFDPPLLETLCVRCLEEVSPADRVYLRARLFCVSCAHSHRWSKMVVDLVERPGISVSMRHESRREQRRVALSQFSGPFLSSMDVSGVLGFSSIYVTQLVKRGFLSGEHDMSSTGRPWRILKQSVVDFVEGDFG